MEYKVKYQTRGLMNFNSKWIYNETILVADEKDIKEVGCECLLANKFGIWHVYNVLECTDMNGNTIEKGERKN